MKVKELIQELQKVEDQDLRVFANDGSEYGNEIQPGEVCVVEANLLNGPKKIKVVYIGNGAGCLASMFDLG
jgi:hypothetical protein